MTDYNGFFEIHNEYYPVLAFKFVLLDNPVTCTQNLKAVLIADSNITLDLGDVGSHSLTRGFIDEAIKKKIKNFT